MPVPLLSEEGERRINNYMRARVCGRGRIVFLRAANIDRSQANLQDYQGISAGVPTPDNPEQVT